VSADTTSKMRPARWTEAEERGVATIIGGVGTATRRVRGDGVEGDSLVFFILATVPDDGLRRRVATQVRALPEDRLPNIA
jgi:hypothetical protein